MGPKVRGHHPHLLLEGLGFLGQQSVCFADDRDDVDFLVHRPQEGHIEGPEPAPSRDGSGPSPRVHRVSLFPPPPLVLPGCSSDPRPKGEMK